ncbi:MAG: DNA-protecting protein DprA [Campylobacteraceae bacterium]|jgi:DNA processing protein|nr:DNA-protecting protein DprA [Campylobacteraceae bacterium]
MHAVLIPQELFRLSDPPKELYALGREELLNSRKIAIVGSRKALFYSKQMCEKLASMLSLAGITVVSGAATGIDAAAHIGAFPNTIAVLANSLDIYYPKINFKLIEKISKEGLLLSEYPATTYATRYSFVLRNRLVVAMSEALVIAQADLNSGSLRSAEFALELGIPIYVFPHRKGESPGTAELVKNAGAIVMDDFEAFVKMFSLQSKTCAAVNDEVLEFVAKNSDLNACLREFGNRIYEYELEGKIVISQMKVKVS